MESQPTKIFEYMAAARPFIASDFPAWRALLGQFRCGVFVDPKSVGAILTAIDKILLDRQDAADMGARGRAALVEHFTFEGESGALISLCTALLPATPGVATRTGIMSRA
jgi:glycosyltransferase involved in cell wall biosynthesis